MSRLEMSTPNQAQLIVEQLYKNLERRIESSPPGLCPIDVSKAFLELCHAQDVLKGNATMETLTLIEKTADSIMHSADCAIGYEAARMVLTGLVGFRDDYESHIQDGKCTCNYKQAIPCKSLCPAQVDIPGYIALVKTGRYQDAIRLIRKDNPFPTTCGFICEHPCEAGRIKRRLLFTAYGPSDHCF